MASIQGISDEIVNDRSGTFERPLLVNIVPGKCGKGYVFIIKIADRYYEMVRNKAGQKYILMRCKEAVNKAAAKCPFTMRVRNISGLDPSSSPEDYWRKSSWEILPTPQPKIHSCAGYECSTESEGTRLNSYAYTTE